MCLENSHPRHFRCPSSQAGTRRLARVAGKLPDGSTKENRASVEANPELFSPFAGSRASAAAKLSDTFGMMAAVTDRSFLVRMVLAGNPFAQAHPEVIETLKAQETDARVLAVLAGGAPVIRKPGTRKPRRRTDSVTPKAAPISTPGTGIDEAPASQPVRRFKAGTAEAFGQDLGRMVEKFGPVSAWHQQDAAMERARVMRQTHPIAAHTIEEETAVELFQALTPDDQLVALGRFPASPMVIREAVFSTGPARGQALHAETTTTRRLIFLAADQAPRVRGGALMTLHQRALIADSRTEPTQAASDLQKLRKTPKR